jgi:hypothetical protein
MTRDLAAEMMLVRPKYNEGKLSYQRHLKGKADSEDRKPIDKQHCNCTKTATETKPVPIRPRPRLVKVQNSYQTDTDKQLDELRAKVMASIERRVAYLENEVLPNIDSIVEGTMPYIISNIPRIESLTRQQIDDLNLPADVLDQINLDQTKFEYLSAISKYRCDTLKQSKAKTS